MKKEAERLYSNLERKTSVLGEEFLKIISRDVSLEKGYQKINPPSDNEHSHKIINWEKWDSGERLFVEFPGNLWQLKFKETISRLNINNTDITITKMANKIINLSGITGNQSGLNCFLNEFFINQNYPFDESKIKFKDSEDSLISINNLLRNINNYEHTNFDISFNIDINPRNKTALIKSAYWLS